MRNTLGTERTSFSSETILRALWRKEKEKRGKEKIRRRRKKEGGKGGVAPNHRRDYASDAREQRSIEGRRRSNMKEGRKKKEGENPGKREERKEKRDPIQATRTLALSC